MVGIILFYKSDFQHRPSVPCPTPFPHMHLTNKSYGEIYMGYDEIQSSKEEIRWTVAERKGYDNQCDL